MQVILLDGQHDRLLLPLADALDLDQLHRIPLPLDQLPQHGFLIQTVHDCLEVAFGLGRGLHILQPVLYPERLHSSDAGGPPLLPNPLDDAQVRNDCRIAQFAFTLTPITGAALLDLQHLFLLDKTVQNGGERRLQNRQGWVFRVELEHESLQMPLNRDLRGELFCAQEHRGSFAGCGVLVTVFPGPLIVGPRNLAQGASLKSLPREFQGCCSSPVSAAWLVVVEFNSFSSHVFNELSRNLHRLPTFRAGTFRLRAIPSSVFQCIPRIAAASRKSSSGSKDGEADPSLDF